MGGQYCHSHAFGLVGKYCATNVVSNNNDNYSNKSSHFDSVAVD